MRIMSTVLSFAARLPMDPLPNPDAKTPPGMSGFVEMMGWAKWIALSICIIGLMVAGAMMAFGGRRGEGGEHLGKLGWALGGVIVISAAAALVGFLATA